MEHPDDRQIEGYTRRTLAPPDLLAVDDHLAGCEGCRRRAGALAGVSRSLTGLRAELLPPGSHLGDEDASDYVAGRLSAPRRAALEQHVGACATCAREVDDVRAWTRPRSVRRPVWYAVAAAVLLAALVPLLLRSRAPSPATRSTVASIAGFETLPSAQRAQLEAALQEGVALPPSYLAGLGGGREALMGASSPSSFHVLAPLATAVVSDRPTFRWEPLAGANRYVVSVSDEALRPVVVSGPLSATSWSPDPPLARGRTYVWQVTAQRGAESVTAPAPPAPLAKIRVLDGETARVLDQTAATHPGSHLLLGILYAQAGVRGEAETQLSQVTSSDPHHATAQRTLERIRAPAAVGR